MHPYFWSSDPRSSAAEIKKLWPEKAAEIIATADNIMEGTFTFQDHWEMERCRKPVHFGPEPEHIQWDLIPFGDPEWIYALNRHTVFLNLAKAWLYTGDSGYLRHLARLMEDWIDRNPLVPEAEANVWRSLEAGLRCEFWLRTLCLTEGRPELSGRLGEKICSCLRTHGEYLVRKSGDFQKFSNWGVLQDHGLFLLGVWFQNQDWIRLAVSRLDLELHRQVMADGCHWEHSPMYHCEVLHCAIDTVLIARQNQISLPVRFEENTARMCHAVLGMTAPDGTLLLQGDTDAIDARNEMALGALLFGDPQLRSAAGEIPFPENLWDLGLDALRLSSLPAEDPELSLAQPDSGNFLLRTDGSRDSAYLHFYCGSVGGGHGHADQLHIDAGIGEEPVLMDSGRYTYTDVPIRMELKAPAAHNTVTVDGMDFTEGADTWSWKSIAVPFKGEYRFTPDADFLSGHHMGYLRLGVAATREILWLRRWNTAVIFDQLLSGSEATHSYRQYFHFAPGQISLEGKRVRWRGKKAAADLICMDAVTCSLDQVPCSCRYNELSSCDRLTVSQSGTGFTGFLTVLDLNAASPLKVRSLPITCAAGKLEDPRARALELIRDNEQAVVILRSGDAVPPRALLEAGGYEGYGRALLFDTQNPDGLCLAW